MPEHLECASFSDEQLIELIAEDTLYLKCVNNRTRDYCIRFMQQQFSNLDQQLIRDCYHDALIVLYEKARGGHFRLTCSLQTYLNSVCRNQLLNLLKKEARITTFIAEQGSETDEIQLQYDTAIVDWLHNDDTGINSERIQAIQQGLEEMKGKGDCHELLMMVHYKDKSMKEVAAHFGYKTEQIARNKNYLCREKLKALTAQIMKQLK
jgi:RNA polymerase sigma factor (sigma-70 family)